MAADKEAAESEIGHAYDIGRIRQLVRLMRDNDLSEVDISWEGSRVKLKRGSENGLVYAPQAMPVSMPVAHAAAPAPAATVPAASGAVPAAPAKPASNLTPINSPIVGTFYSSPNPDADPFVKVGSKVSPDTVVCIIEAMKVFNEIQAGVSGTIAEILVASGSAVEYGQVLFRVE
jgi:acetyl-CoA carboxylase biotin carboxyl carrier protein